MHFILETERLLLSEFDNDDALFIIELLNSPGWLKYIGERNVRTETQAHSYIEKLRSSYENYGFGFWKVTSRELNRPVGMCGLIKREELKHVDIGFAFLPDYQGRGFALESATAVKDYALKHLDLNDLLAITNTDNTSSMKVLLKIGMKYDGNIEMNNEELMLFKLHVK